MELKILKDLIAQVLSVDPNEITLETSFVDDLGADSLDIYQIVMGIEEEFGISLSPEEVGTVSVVQEAMELILSKKPL